MNIVLNINNVEQEVSLRPGDTLLKTLRRLGFFGVKHGCEHGEMRRVRHFAGWQASQ